jgi:hypothetical protein
MEAFFEAEIILARKAAVYAKQEHLKLGRLRRKQRGDTIIDVSETQRLSESTDRVSIEQNVGVGNGNCRLIAGLFVPLSAESVEILKEDGDGSIESTSASSTLNPESSTDELSLADFEDDRSVKDSVVELNVFFSPDRRVQVLVSQTYLERF